MTKINNCTTIKVDSCQIPDRVLETVQYLRSSRTFCDLCDEDQIAYASMLIEAEDWAHSYGFRTVLSSKNLNRGGKYER